MWQALREELRPQGLELVTVALDSGGAAAARPWIEAAQPRHTALIDAAHTLDTVFGIVRQRLHPTNWTYKRQAWKLAGDGAAEIYGTDWLGEVEKIGPEHYYPALNMPPVGADQRAERINGQTAPGRR